MAASEAVVFPGFLTTSFPKPQTTFLTNIAEVRGEIRRKESLPQPGIELTTTRALVRHVHHRATWEGYDCKKPIKSMTFGLQCLVPRDILLKTTHATTIV